MIWLRRLLTGDARIARVRAALAERTASIALRQANAPLEAQRPLASAVDLLASAQEALRGEPDLNRAWTLLLEADCIALEALTDEELQAKAAMLREEVRDKLSAWRESGALRVLGDPGTRASLAGTQEAMRTLNGHFHNQYFKLDLVESQVLWIGVVLLVCLVAVFVASWRSVRPLDVYTSVLAWSMLLGAIGGALSAAQSLTEGSKKRRIPEQLADTPVTLTRPIVGAAAGAMAALLVVAGVASIGAKNDQLAPLCAAFVAGFSERYFLSLIPKGEK
jgi:hypothetical protein